MKIAIVGGGAAGTACATRLRRLNENDEIVIFEKSGELALSNCGLPLSWTRRRTPRRNR